MWIRKAENDIKKQSSLNLNPLPPIIIGLIMSLISIVWVKWSIGLYLFCFIFAYIGQIFFDDLLLFLSIIVSGTITPKEVLIICNKCQNIRTKSSDNDSKCLCGGELEPIENWVWEDNDSIESKETK